MFIILGKYITMNLIHYSLLSNEIDAHQNNKKVYAVH